MYSYVPPSGPNLYPEGFIYEITLINLKTTDCQLARVSLTTLAGESFAAFELVGATDAGNFIQVDATLSCEDVYVFQVKYLPGYNQNWETRNDYGQVMVHILDPNTGELILADRVYFHVSMYPAAI